MMTGYLTYLESRLGKALNGDKPRRIVSGQRGGEIVDFVCGCVATLADGDPDTFWFQDVKSCRTPLEHRQLR
jgi:hypothetical protein